MDETSVRRHVQAHGKTIVEDDMDRAIEDLTEEATPKAPGIIAQLPKPTTEAEVLKVDLTGEEAVVHIRYGGEAAATTVESRWHEIDGVPKTVDAEVISRD